MLGQFQMVVMKKYIKQRMESGEDLESILLSCTKLTEEDKNQIKEELSTKE